MGGDKRLLLIARRLAASRSGVAMFELAITLPILLIIFAGGWELARGLLAYDTLNKGVRDASRYLARVDDPTSALSLTMAQRLVLSGDIDVDQPPRLDYTKVTIQVDKKTFDNSGGTYRGPDGGTADIDVIQVRADMVYDTPLLGFINFASPITLTVMHQERHIGD
ncbi:MAG: pilus assembly protein [Alphaproteobacteria bacterium]|nr:pilus assembly protein [Alphaproteobacteria bacterium]